MSKVEFILSATHKSHYPILNLPEIALLGRSNSGKSSFINSFFNRKKLAFVSNTPGKTQAINFFKADDSYIFVDLPGYGFAQVSKKLKGSWKSMIEQYLVSRDTLSGALLVMDIRRNWSEDEQMLLNWCAQNEIPLLVLLNKSDKLSKNKQDGRIRELTLEAPEAKFLKISAFKRQGIEEVKSFIFNHWIKA